MKGILALDIDGTLTLNREPVKASILRFLESLHLSGWELFFITGRTRYLGERAITGLRCPHTLAAYNGALVLEKPADQVLAQRFLQRSLLNAIGDLSGRHATDVVVYGGSTESEVCYYRPTRWSTGALSYLTRRTVDFGETLVPVKDFDEVPKVEVPSIKCFGEHEALETVSRSIESELGLHAPVIRDPYAWEYSVLQATSSGVSKGGALQAVLENRQAKVVAVGDDYNDLSMFEVADISIAMETAPDAVRAKADRIAPSAEKDGIIEALEQVVGETDES